MLEECTLGNTDKLRAVDISLIRQEHLWNVLPENTYFPQDAKKKKNNKIKVSGWFKRGASLVAQW